MGTIGLPKVGTILSLQGRVERVVEDVCGCRSFVMQSTCSMSFVIQKYHIWYIVTRAMACIMADRKVK